MAASEYTDVLASLYALEAAKGMDFKLERVALALKNLGDPHTKLAAVHIAGTNGKGSVAAMVHSICSAAGYRVGLYTSPHLVSFTDRIRIGEKRIGEREVVELAREIRTAATVRGIDLTFFEFVTVMAFLHFARHEVDLVVVEVGLGGRLDATNVVEPEVAVITTIGLDHQEYLGDTVASVAREKAGIIKARCPVVVGRVPDEARNVLASVATEQQAPGVWWGCDFLAESAPLRFRGMGSEIGDIVVSLRGAYQHENAATAIAIALVLRKTRPISDDAIRQGLGTVHWPGRLDVVQTNPLVVLDGAHNVDGIATLVRNLPAIVGHRRIHLLFGVMRDKRWQPMVDALGPHVSRATLTTVLPPRGETPDALAQAFRQYCPASVTPQALPALESILHIARDDEAVVVTGSLFLIGAVYPFFLARRGQQHLFSSGGAAL